MQRLLFFLLLVTGLKSYGQQFTLYLIGDAGHAAQTDSAVMILKEQLSNESGNAAVIFLGDNVYPRGLYPENSNQRPEGEEQLLAQFESVKNFSGQVFFIPGNHDWKKSRWNGLRHVKLEEEFVKEKLPLVNTVLKNPESCFLPLAGLPGPTVVTLDSALKLKLVVIDIQWWLHQQFFHKVDKPEGMSVKETERLFFASLEKILSDAEKNHEKIIIAAHHPLLTIGQHSELDEPLHAIVTYIPPLQIFRLMGLNRLFRQDIESAAYSKLTDSLVNIIEQHEDVLFVSGHDHNLQFFFEEKVNNMFIVSGAGSGHLPFVQDTSATLLFREDCCDGFFKVTFDSNGVDQVIVFSSKNPEGFFIRKKWNK